jgi:hypothetical protein
MRNFEWKKLALALLSGTILFQTPGCTETAAVVTAVSSALTAGGLLYLVNRVID